MPTRSWTTTGKSPFRPETRSSATGAGDNDKRHQQNIESGVIGSAISPTLKTRHVW